MINTIYVFANNKWEVLEKQNGTVISGSFNIPKSTRFKSSKKLTSYHQNYVYIYMDIKNLYIERTVLKILQMVQMRCYEMKRVHFTIY